MEQSHSIVFVRRTPQDDGVTKGDGSRRNTSAMRSSQKKETRPHTSVHATSVFPRMWVTHACTMSFVEASVCGARRGTNSPPCHILCTTEHSRQFWTLDLRPCSLQSNNQRFRSLRSCQSKCAGKETSNDRAPFLVPLSFCAARDTCFPPHDATIRHFRHIVADGKGCGSRLRRQHESRELIPSP